MTEQAAPTPNATRQRLDELARRAALAIGWERVWPILALALVIFALFLAVSFLGLWLETPRWGRILGSVLFALAIAAAFARLATLHIARRAERLARLDRDSGLAHQPATTLEDQVANGGADPVTQALWRLHRQRAEQAASTLKICPPSPHLAGRDVYALRAAAMLAVVAAGFVAGPEKYARVLAAFDWRTEGVLSAGYRLDAWIDPPAYTGRPPIVLNLRDDAGRDAKREFFAPEGSTVIVRASAGGNIGAEAEGGLAALNTDSKTTEKPIISAPEQAGGADSALRFSLHGDGKLIIKRFGSVIATFALTSIPDLPPVITLKGDPKSNARGSLTLAYKISDDYGVTGAEAQFDKPVVAGKPVTGRTLAEAPKMQLTLPSGPGGLGEAETTADLSETPWAGARVTMTLSARDEGGNEGRSEPIGVTLPQRPFTKPLARALVEQRRNLVLSPDDRTRVVASIDALTIAPEKFGTSIAVYLGLHTIAIRLENARTDQDLLETADFMWEMALRIEDGDLPQAERDLRAAEQQLRDAMQRGAPDEEIKQLMDQLRAAMDKYLSEMARRQQNDQNAQQDQRQNGDQRSVTPDQLQSMLDKMQEMMKNGDMAEAQKLLDQLQNLMENLQTAQRPRRPDARSQEMNRAIDELDQLSREEQELRDRTFRGDENKQKQSRPNRPQNGQQGQKQPGQKGQQGEQQPGDQADSGNDEDGDQAANPGGDQETLAERQKSLRQRLENLKKRMQQFGLDGKEGLDSAEESMREAENQLGEGDAGRGKAVDAEGKAIEALRKGAQQLAQQMQQQGRQAGQGGGPGDPGGRQREGQDNANADPLGRNSFGKKDPGTQRYDPFGTPLAQRAQRVLEELRKRLGDANRPQDEIDYLERLMKRY